MLDSTNKIIQHMKTNIAKPCHVKSLKLPVRNPDSNRQVSEIKQTNLVRPEHKHANEALSLKPLYEPIHLVEFEPEDRYARRH